MLGKKLLVLIKDKGWNVLPKVDSPYTDLPESTPITPDPSLITVLPSHPSNSPFTSHHTKKDEIKEKKVLLAKCQGFKLNLKQFNCLIAQLFCAVY